MYDYFDLDTFKLSRAHMAGRLNLDLDPEARAKPLQFILQMWGGGLSPDFKV
jgi:hypothetical protein